MTSVLSPPQSAAITSGDLPEGWTVASVNTLAELVRGVSYKKGEALTSPEKGHVALIRANNIDGQLVFDDLQYVPEARVSDEQMLRAGDIVIAMSSGSKKVVGKTAQLRDSWIGAFGAFCGVLRPHPNIESKYLGWFLQTSEYRNAISEGAAGTNINNLSRGHFDEILVPMPPLLEQKRIVSVIDGLTIRVDAGRERLAKVPAILKRFRQAVLAAACSGQLTEDWRKQHTSELADRGEKLVRKIDSERERSWQEERQTRGRDSSKANCPIPAEPTTEFDLDVPNEWPVASIERLTQTITSGSRDWKQYYKESGPGTFIMAQNIRPMYLDRSFKLGVDPPEDNRDRVRSQVRRGDVLVTIVGANTGDVCRVPETVDQHYVCQSVALMRPVSDRLAPWLELWLNSPAHGKAQFDGWIYGEGRPHISFDHIKATAVALPPYAEQEEIVRRVHTLMKLADAIEQRVALASSRADKTTQAILAKAFRGELVPTEAGLARAEGRDFESAEELLRRLTVDACPTAPNGQTTRRAGGRNLQCGKTRVGTVSVRSQKK